jgi:hypothetical protein
MSICVNSPLRMVSHLSTQVGRRNRYEFARPGYADRARLDQLLEKSA